jgi:flagellar biosynthesis component FlhA
MSKKTDTVDLCGDVLEQLVGERVQIRDSEVSAIVEVLADQQETARLSLEVFERCVSKFCDTMLEIEVRKEKLRQKTVRRMNKRSKPIAAAEKIVQACGHKQSSLKKRVSVSSFPEGENNN